MHWPRDRAERIERRTNQTRHDFGFAKRARASAFFRTLLRVIGCFAEKLCGVREFCVISRENRRKSRRSKRMIATNRCRKRCAKLIDASASARACCDNFAGTMRGR